MLGAWSVLLFGCLFCVYDCLRVDVAICVTASLFVLVGFFDFAYLFSLLVCDLVRVWCCRICCMLVGLC